MNSNLNIKIRLFFFILVVLSCKTKFSLLVSCFKANNSFVYLCLVTYTLPNIPESNKYKDS